MKWTPAYYFLIVLAISLASIWSRAAVEQKVTSAGRINIKDIIKENLKTIQTANCVFGTVVSASGEITLGLVTRLGAATFHYPASSAEESWALEDESHLLYKYGTRAFIKFTYDSDLKFTSALLYADGGSADGNDTVYCDFKSRQN